MILGTLFGRDRCRMLTIRPVRCMRILQRPYMQGFTLSRSFHSTVGDVVQLVRIQHRHGQFPSPALSTAKHAVVTVLSHPAEVPYRLVSPRHVIPPSPRTSGLGLRISVFFRGHLWVYFRYGPVTRPPSLRWLCRSASPASLSSAGTTQAKGLLTFLSL